MSTQSSMDSHDPACQHHRDSVYFPKRAEVEPAIWVTYVHDGIPCLKQGLTQNSHPYRRADQEC